MSDVRYTLAMAGIRERARAATVAEILRLAREQLAQEGAAALSLRAIARDMGMVSSAIYRYFSSRDELLTQLIVESYDSLGDAVAAADASCARRGDYTGRWKALAHAVRAWAVANPSEYALLYGTPVPGYAAPPDTIGPASRYTSHLLDLLADMTAAGHRGTRPVPASLRPDLRRLRSELPLAIDERLLSLGLASWATLIGAITLELFGHLHNVVNEPGALFDAVVDGQANLLVAGTAPAARASNPT